MPKAYTKVAIAYDFDGTLAKGNIQENSFLPEIGISKKTFWKEVKRISEAYEMDEILAYMYLLLEKAKAGNAVRIDKENLKKHGKNVQYFNGVEEYFDRINEYARHNRIKLLHYIISSGTKEMIEGTTIAKKFDYIYASSFMYDQHHVAVWPALAINYTAKTQYLFRINKGIKNAWDNSKINSYTPANERDIPFEHMIYIGDGLTDVPAMKLVKSQGGCAIGVYAPNTRQKSQVLPLLAQKRVNYVAPADYTQGSDLDTIVKATIDQIAAKERIVKFQEILPQKKRCKK